MSIRATLSALRAGRPPEAEALAEFAAGLASGAVSDAQAGAFAMGICRAPLAPAGRVALTEAMVASGQRLVWPEGAPVIDKHSTGGVGDTVSLVLAPALAACGARVPMVSGRGLGHTGGTLDKLEAIPGFRCDLSEAELRSIVSEVGCAIVSAGPELAPADRRLYAVRDVTGTVESIDLICASILSKKIAAGLQALVLDVKCGAGALVPAREEAEKLARALVAVARGAGVRAVALLTDMSEPLADAMGNALEVRAALRVLRGGGGPLLDVSAGLGGAVLAQAGLAATREAGEALVLDAVERGAALARFEEMVAAQGAEPGWEAALAEAPVQMEITAREAGTVLAIDGRILGEAVVALGGGRRVETDRIDPAVGLAQITRLGARLEAGAPLAVIHAASASAAETAADAVRGAIRLGRGPARPPRRILETFS